MFYPIRPTTLDGTVLETPNEWHPVLPPVTGGRVDPDRPLFDGIVYVNDDGTDYRRYSLDGYHEYRRDCFQQTRVPCDPFSRWALLYDGSVIDRRREYSFERHGRMVRRVPRRRRFGDLVMPDGWRETEVLLEREWEREPAAGCGLRPTQHRETEVLLEREQGPAEEQPQQQDGHHSSARDEESTAVAGAEGSSAIERDPRSDDDILSFTSTGTSWTYVDTPPSHAETVVSSDVHLDYGYDSDELWWYENA